MGESKLNYLNTDEFRKVILSKNLSFAYYKSIPIPASKTPSDDLQHNNTVTGVIDQPDITPIDNWNGRLSFYSPELVQTYQNLDVRLPDYGFNINEGQPYNSGNFQFETPANIISVLTGRAIRNADTPMARLSTEFLTRSIYSNISENFRNLTIDRINLNPENLLLGTEPVITRDFQITVPGTPITRAAEYMGRLSGVEIPRSYIPGEFFEDRINKSRFEEFVDDTRERIGNILNLDFNGSKGRNSYNQKLLQYTSNGQKSVYYKNLNYNVYKPDHEKNSNRNIIQRIGDQVRDFIGVGAPNENTYVSLNLLDSIENKGRFVSGQSIIAKEFEIGNIPSNFMWKGSSETFENFFVTDVGSFPDKSIISYTKKIVDEFDTLTNDIDKLTHPGSVISNLSKKFHDGSKIISKGNATKGENGEFCRVWTKDDAYDQYGKLMRFEGMTTTQRRFKDSILSSTANLNIGPTRDEDGEALNFGGDVTKYMFSIENLAWKDSEELDDRPLCEVGTNKGRVMWFPPYDLKFSDDTSANWTEHKILGRPEPIYTYQNTTRTGNLSFKIVVDHPSIFNKIRDKKLKDKTKDLSEDDIINEFVNGCRDYDIYELASELTFLSQNEILTLNNLINDFGKEGLTYDNDRPNIPDDSQQSVVLPEEKTLFEQEIGETFEVRLFWDNDIPGPSDKEIPSTNYETDFNSYASKKMEFRRFNQDLNTWNYLTLNKFFDEILPNSKESLDNVIPIIKKTIEKDKIHFDLSIRASASEPGSIQYNQLLSKRRLNGIKKYILSKIGEQYESFLRISETAVGETTQVTIDGTTYDCREKFNTNDEAIYSKRASFCRSASVKFKIDKTSIERPTPEPVKTKKTEENKKISYDGENTKKDILNLILKSLSTECDYFIELNENSPLNFKSLEEKLKYFHPTFHSTTPEGLNSRLTFLQQCVRPGNTLKVTNTDGTEQFDISSNTSFGKPPVCVLRIGDFFHSKIIIESVQITYDESPLDLNPEGIGVQPMIATVTMRVNYIGGQSLSNAVSEIQNALSFNFYANTEVYEPKLVKQNIDEKRQKKFDDLLNSFNDRLQEKTLEELNIAEANLKDDFWGNVIQETPFTEDVDGDVMSYTQTYKEFKIALNDYFTHFDELINSDISPYFWYGSVKFDSMSNYNVNYASITNNLNVKLEDFRDRLKKHIKDTIESLDGFVMFSTQFETTEESYEKIDEYIDDIYNHQLTEIIDHHSNVFGIIESRTNLKRLINQMEIILYDGIDGYIDGDEVVTVQLTQRPSLSLDMKKLYEKDKENLNGFIGVLNFYIDDVYRKMMSGLGENEKDIKIGLSDIINKRNFNVNPNLLSVQKMFNLEKTPKNKTFGDITRDNPGYGIYKNHFNEGVNFDEPIFYNFIKTDDLYHKTLIRKYEERWR